jgi:hypothetical protein
MAVRYADVIGMRPEPSRVKAAVLTMLHQDAVPTMDAF